MTLTRFMIEATRNNKDHADIESLMSSIQMACKTISNLVSRAAVEELSEQDDQHENLVITSNNILKNALRFTGKLGVLASEEEDHPVLIEEAYNSKYVAVFDPLDGSSNIGVGISTGTIFGIFKENDFVLIQDETDKLTSAQEKTLIQTLQPGTNLVAAGYCMYSSSTTLVFSLGEGTHGFTLDPTIGEFILTHPNMRIPKRGKIYSFNEARSQTWHQGLQQYVQALKSGRGETGASYSSRYIGSMVGDVHRTLLKGGVFGYPADARRPHGKLRLLHEAAPMAFLLEQAGGKASTGSGRILDVPASSLRQQVPTFLGSPDDVSELEKYIAAATTAASSTTTTATVEAVVG